MQGRFFLRCLVALSVPLIIAALAGVSVAQVAVSQTGYGIEPGGTLLPTVTVTATAAVQVEPTLATVSAAVDASSETATGAEELVRTKLEELGALLAERGVALTAGHFTVYPRWDFQGDSGPVRSGFEARRQISVTVGEVERVSEVLQLLLDSEVSEINGITYGLKDESEARRQAIEKALADANSQADVTARTLGGRVWTIRSVLITGGVNAYYGGPVAWDGARPVAPQPVTIEVTVTVEYLLLPH